MNEQENIRVVRRIFDAFGRGNLKAILDCCAEDIEVQHPMPEAIWSWAGHNGGKQSFEEYLRGVISTFSVEKVEAREFCAGRQSRGQCL